MGTTLSALTRPGKTVIFTTPHAVKAMSLQVSYWTDEVNFYYILLTWSTFSGQENLRRKLQRLTTALASLRDRQLPALKTGLDACAMDNNTVLPARLSSRLKSTERTINRLKSEIFKHANDLVRITIW